MSYCRVASLPTRRASGSVLLISGTDVQSTEAGGDLVTNEVWLHRLRDKLAVARGGRCRTLRSCWKASSTTTRCRISDRGLAAALAPRLSGAGPRRFG